MQICKANINLTLNFNRPIKNDTVLKQIIECAQMQPGSTNIAHCQTSIKC